LGAQAGQVLFWDGSTLMDGKKRHHQAMDPGNGYGASKSKVLSGF
jgi:hypothetical protein